MLLGYVGWPTWLGRTGRKWRDSGQWVWWKLTGLWTLGQLDGGWNDNKWGKSEGKGQKCRALSFSPCDEHPDFGKGLNCLSYMRGLIQSLPQTATAHYLCNSNANAPTQSARVHPCIYQPLLVTTLNSQQKGLENSTAYKNLTLCRWGTCTNVLMLLTCTLIANKKNKKM